MAVRTLDKGGQELMGAFPKFEEIGDYVEGHFLEFVIDDWDNKCVVLYKGEDEETGEAKTQKLPPAADLRRYYNQFERGMWLHIEFAKVIPSNNEKYSDKKIFLVQADEERDVEFGDAEDE